jgi:peptide/nickel transport system substrate-binding protein
MRRLFTRFSRVGLFAIATSLLLTACEKKQPRTSAGHPLPQPPCIASCEPGRCGGELHLTLSGNPRTFNPLAAKDAASQDMVRFLFASLTSMDWQTQEVRPALAESWSADAGGKTWTFKLRRGLRWSDGHPLTADDLLFTWNDVIYARRGATELADIFSLNGTNFAVTKVDETTIKVVTPEIFAPFLEFFGSVPVLPKHILAAPQPDNAPPMAQDQIACSGPFRIKRYTPDSFLVLERNPEYWAVDKSGQRLPYFDFIIFTIVPNNTDPAALFLAGQSDAHERIAMAGYDDFQQAAAAGKIQLLSAGPAVEKDILWFNQNTNNHPLTGRPLVNPARLKWFRSQKFRQAISLAIDRDRIIRSVYGGRAEPSQGLIGSENRKWSNANIARSAYNPAKARELLAELGMKDQNHNGILEDADGNMAEFVFSSNLGNPARVATAKLITEDLRKLGLQVDLQTLPFPLLSKNVNAGDYECVLLGLGGGGLDPVANIHALKSDDPGCQWFPEQPKPSTEWEARINSLMDAQMSTLDFAARKKAFDEVQTILAEQLPLIPIVSPNAYTAVGRNIGNARPSALTPYRATWNVEELYRK